MGGGAWLDWGVQKGWIGDRGAHHKLGLSDSAQTEVIIDVVIIVATKKIHQRTHDESAYFCKIGSYSVVLWRGLVAFMKELRWFSLSVVYRLGMSLLPNIECWNF